MQPKINFKTVLIICFGLIFQIQSSGQSHYEALLSEVDSLLSEDQDQEAKLLLDSIRPFVNKNSGMEDWLGYHKLLGDYFLSQNLYEEAIEAYEPVLGIDTRELGKEPTLSIAKAINDLGIAYQKNGKPQEAVRAHKKSLELYQLYNDAQGSGFNYNNIAILYAQRKLVDSAIYFHNKSIEYAHLADDTLGLGFNLIGIAIIYADNKEPVKALDYFHRSLEVFTSVNHQGMINGTRRRIAVMYARLKDFESAIRIQKEVLAYYESTGSKLGLGNTHNNIAELLLEMNELDTSKYHIDKSIEYFVPTGYAKGLAKSYNLLGRYYKLKGVDAKAIENYQKSLDYSGTEPGMHLANWTGVAKIYLDQGKNKEMIDMIQAALDKANYSASPGNLAAAYNVLYQAFKNIGNQKKALEYLELYNEQRDLVFDDERLVEVARIEYRAQLERERAIEKEQQERVKLEYQQELTRERWIRIAAITLTVLVGLIAFFAFRAYRIKREANVLLSEKNTRLKELRENEKRLSEDALASKDRELATMAMASHEKNALLKDLEQKVSFIEKRMGDELKPSLKDMKKAISDSYSLDKSWDSFLHRFEDVHPHFFDRLKGDNPNLTVEDLKLSAYLKIGMSNKEIANVTHLTLGSVKSKINRLKKKLEVGPEDSVRDYMLKYA